MWRYSLGLVVGPRKSAQRRSVERVFLDALFLRACVQKVETRALERPKPTGAVTERVQSLCGVLLDACTPETPSAAVGIAQTLNRVACCRGIRFERIAALAVPPTCTGCENLCTRLSTCVTALPGYLNYSSLNRHGISRSRENTESIQGLL